MVAVSRAHSVCMEVYKDGSHPQTRQGFDTKSPAERQVVLPSVSLEAGHYIICSNLPCRPVLRRLIILLRFCAACLRWCCSGCSMNMEDRGTLHMSPS